MNTEYTVIPNSNQNPVTITVSKGDSIFPETFTTDRLRFKQLSFDYLSELYELTKSTPKSIFEYCWWKDFTNKKDLYDYISAARSNAETGEKAEYVIIEKESDEIIGASHLSPDWTYGIGRLGIWLHPDFWGNGYAFEQTVASISIHFMFLDMPVVQAWCTKNNTNSKRALEKTFTEFGGKCDGCIRRGYFEDKIVFSVTQEEYNSPVELSYEKTDTNLPTTINTT